MTGENQKKALEALSNSQRQLLDVPEELLTDYVQVVGETYVPMFLDEYSNRLLRVHSLSSFVVRKAAGTKIIFGELFHIGEAVAVGVNISHLEQTRLLYVELDAEAIALPPGVEFDPFCDVVKVPVAAIQNIEAA